MPEAGTIAIGRPFVERADGKARLTSVIRRDDVDVPVWVEVEERYGRYLCDERSDAFLLGLLNLAMREGRDVVCEAPVGAQLLFQLRTYLIPILANHDPRLRAISVVAEPDGRELPCAGAVATGASCGVDSMHAIMNYGGGDPAKPRLTHLVLNKIGGIAVRRGRWDAKVRHVADFCSRYGFELVAVGSNFSVAFPQDHLLTDFYSNSLCVYALCKLWNVYFYGSAGFDISHFSVTDSSLYGCALYDLLAFDVFSTKSLRIYSEGMDVERFEKLRRIADFAPSHTHLDVCLRNSGRNCGDCPKCRRTQIMLDALGRLDDYADVFDVAAYRANRKHYLRWLYEQQIRPDGDFETIPAYAVLKSDVTFRIKWPVWTHELRRRLSLAFGSRRGGHGR